MELLEQRPEMANLGLQYACLMQSLFRHPALQSGKVHRCPIGK